MASKPNVENRWWVETSVKKPKLTKVESELPTLPIAMSFYSIAKDYEQERAKEAAQAPRRRTPVPAAAPAGAPPPRHIRAARSRSAE